MNKIKVTIKRWQIPCSWSGLYSHRFMKLHFKTLGNAATIGQKQVMGELYVLENVPQPGFHKDCSFFPTCHLCKANNV